jgi:membrane associated rhomboid family serine protease
MGIHDRDYYRDSGSRWGSASEHRGVIALIAVTVALSLAAFAVTEPRTELAAEGAFDPDHGRVLTEALRFDYGKVVGEWQVWRPFTSFLLTNDIFLGLIFGMLLLYFFGGELEILYGTGRFLTFYLLTGVLANVLKLLLGAAGVGVAYKLADGTSWAVTTYGTAAPMFATMVLFAFHYPHRPIRIWFLIPVPVWLLVCIYLGLHGLLLLGTVANRSGEGVPHAIEPLVGAAVGFVYYRTRGRVFAFADWFGRRERARRSPANLRVYDDNAPRPSTRSSSPPPAAVPEPVPQPAGGGVDEHLEAKLDAVLAKVARHGKGSLTAEENDILMRASEVFKRKRR